MSAPVRASHRVWDLPTRLCHWALPWLLAAIGPAASSACCRLPATSGWAMRCSSWSCSAAVGPIGSDSARFSHFLRGPRAVATYLGRLPGPQPTHWPGHNPLGGWAVLLLLVVTGLHVLTGLYAERRGVLAGPLAESASRGTVRAMTDLHGLLHWVLLLLVLAHIAAALYYRLRKGEDRIGPMFGSGRMLLPEDPGLRFAGPWRALAVLALSLAVVAMIAARAPA